jgi:uncharacterized delta-60 repeat protein
MIAKISGTKSVINPSSQRRTMHFHNLVKMAALLLVLLVTAIQTRAQNALDGFDPNVTGPNGSTVDVVVVQPDGKILIGGTFSSVLGVPRNHIARLNSDGTLDTAFDANASGDPNTSPTVTAIAVQVDGKILVGGRFSSIGGQTRNCFARLEAATGLADSFDPHASSGAGATYVSSIALQADGKILVGGLFTNIGGQARNCIARLDATTGLADSFNPNPNRAVVSIAVQADGKILIGGGFTLPRSCIARLDPTTGEADSFDSHSSGQVSSIALQADGKILVGGYFVGANSIGGQDRSHIARLDPATGLADSFNPNASGLVVSIALQADGRILAGGDFTSIGGQARTRIARLDPASGLADSFNPGANGDVTSIAVQADGKILVGGGFNGANSIGGQTRNRIARLETDGRVDQTLNLSEIGSYLFATAVQPDGKILIGGTFTSVLGVPRNHIARVNRDGTLDAAFDPNASGPNPLPQITAIAVQADGKILVGGTFTNIGGQSRNFIARLDPTTGLADSFNPNADNRVLCIVPQPDGKILVSGNFTNIGGQVRHSIARLDPTTGLADSFDPNADHEVGSIAVQADGKILVGGYFTNIGGQARSRVARLDPATGLADSFNPTFSGPVYAIALQPDGKILVGGQDPMKRFRPDGTRDTVFNPVSSGVVFTIAVQADGKVLAGGLFESIGGQQRRHIARLDAITGLADSFNPTTLYFSPAGGVNSIVVEADGKILVGGNLSTIGGQMRSLFARLSNDTAATQNLAVTKSTVTWTLGGSSPQLSRVVFEYSPDNVNYTALGNGTAAGSSWTLTGLTLPIEQNFYVRARGHYRGGCQDGSESIMESVRNAFVLRPTTLGNISTRLGVQAGDNAMIGGFIITGTQTKTVVVRGIGPSLPIPGALADPVIEVHGSTGQLLATNDNWNDSLTRQQIIDSGLAPSNDLESALWGVIDPGAYTVVVRGKNDATGIGLFEVYDVDQTAASKLANVSTRGLVATGNDVMIGGAILRGTVAARVLLRAIGPSLTNFGVPNALPDPTLELHDGNGALIAANDNWRTAQEAEITATGLPPSNNLESAIVRDLLPGNYTAIVRGTNNATGVALVEAYELN